MYPDSLYLSLIGAEGVCRSPAIIILLQRSEAAINVLEDVAGKLNVVRYGNVPTLGCAGREIHRIANLRAYPSVFKDVARNHDSLSALELQAVFLRPLITQPRRTRHSVGLFITRRQRASCAAGIPRRWLEEIVAADLDVGGHIGIVIPASPAKHHVFGRRRKEVVNDLDWPRRKVRYYRLRICVALMDVGDVAVDHGEVSHVALDAFPHIHSRGAVHVNAVKEDRVRQLGWMSQSAVRLPKEKIGEAVRWRDRGWIAPLIGGGGDFQANETIMVGPGQRIQRRVAVRRDDLRHVGSVAGPDARPRRRQSAQRRALDVNPLA